MFRGLDLRLKSCDGERELFLHHRTDLGPKVSLHLKLGVGLR